MSLSGPCRVNLYVGRPLSTLPKVSQTWTIVYRNDDFYAARPAKSADEVAASVRLLGEQGKAVLAVCEGDRILEREEVEALIRPIKGSVGD